MLEGFFGYDFAVIAGDFQKPNNHAAWTYLVIWPNIALLLKELAEAKKRNPLNELIFPFFFFLGITLAQRKLHLKYSGEDNK